MPSTSKVALRYYEIPRERLEDLTRLGLIGAGVPDVALGARAVRGRVTLSGCILLSAQARASLPVALGGLGAGGGGASVSSRDLWPAGSPDGAGYATPPGSPLRRGTPSPPGSPGSPDRAILAEAFATAAASAAAAAATADAALRARALVTSHRVTRSVTRGAVEGQPPGGGVPAVPEGALAGAADGSTPAPAGDTLPGGAAGSLDSGDADLNEAMRRASLADIDAAEAAKSLHRANQRTDELLSALSAGGGSSRGGVSPEGGHVDMAREQQILVASTQVVGHTADATALLSSFPARFPLIHRALLKRAGLTAFPSMAEVSILVLVPAVLAARTQMHGLEMLRAAINAHAALGGSVGAANKGTFTADHNFDYHAASAILDEEVDLDAAPVDICLGVLPLTQLALHLWYRDHVYRPALVSPLLDAATRLKFVVQGSLDPTSGMAEFLSLWSAALGSDEDFPSDHIYHKLVVALHRDAAPAGAASAIVIVDGVPTSWTAFAHARLTAWQAIDRSRGALETPVGTRADLEVLVATLVKYGKAVQRLRFVPGGIRPPPGGFEGSASLGIVHMGDAEPHEGPTVAVISAPRHPPNTAPGASTGRRGRGHRRATSGSPPHTGATPPLGPLALPPAVQLTTMIAASPHNILSISPLMDAGWKFVLAATAGARPDKAGYAAGCSVFVPGCAAAFPLRRDPRGNIFGRFMRHGGGYSICDPGVPGDGVDLLMDCGAEVSVFNPADAGLLRDRDGSVAVLTVHGLNGPTIPEGAGTFLVVPPPGAQRVPPRPAAPSRLGGPHLVMRASRAASGPTAVDETPDETRSGPIYVMPSTSMACGVDPPDARPLDGLAGAPELPVDAPPAPSLWLSPRRDAALAPGRRPRRLRCAHLPSRLSGTSACWRSAST